MIKKILFIGLFFVSIAIGNAQDFNLGIRAGLNYSKFLGPLEQGETNSYSDGFHFGMNFAYNVTDLFAINTGLFYIQNGNKQKYEGDSYYLLRPENGTLPNKEKLFENGKSKINLKVSNAYISIPLTANIFLGEKIEIFGGIYANFLISPTGQGTWEFTSNEDKEISFIQGMDHHYYSDKAVESLTLNPIHIGVRDEDFFLPDISKAYTFFDEKEGNKYNVFDFGLTGGVNYYINKGFYGGFRVAYGLTDTTNDKMDISLRDLGENNQFIYTKDKDTHFGLEFSLGFRF